MYTNVAKIQKAKEVLSILKNKKKMRISVYFWLR